MPSTEDEYLTVAEVAEKLRLSQATIRKWLDEGRLPHVRVGRRVRVVKADLEQLMESGYSGSRSGNAKPDADAPTAEEFWSGDIESEQAPAAESSQEPEGEGG